MKWKTDRQYPKEKPLLVQSLTFSRICLILLTKIIDK